MNNLIPKAIAGAFALIVLTVVLGCFYTVDEGERAVVLTNGQIVSIEGPGLHWKKPIVDSVEKISTRTFSVPYQGLKVYSQDQQAATLNVSVTFHVPPEEVGTVYSKYHDVEGLVSKILNRQVPTASENVMGQYSAENAVKNRVQLVADLNKAIRSGVTTPTMIVESVQLENIDFSDAYEKSVEDRMKAEVAVKTREQEREREKVANDIRVNAAKAEADAVRAKADADAYATRQAGDAEAHALEVKAKSLALNPNLIELIKAQTWNGIMPTTMVPGGATPFINIK